MPRERESASRLAAFLREIAGGGSYLWQSDLRANFGLGKSETMDLVEITWPSGANNPSATSPPTSSTKSRKAPTPFPCKNSPSAL